jgi:hypothetical protein
VEREDPAVAVLSDPPPQQISVSDKNQTFCIDRRPERMHFRDEFNPDTPL